MRLQKQRSREVKGKEYYRWTVVIPPEKIKELGWKEGEELNGLVEKKGLTLVPALGRDNSRKS
ncbi:MAG: hypothetical protein ACLQEQ_06785 [Nitrososphaerales archaeon]